MTTSRTRNLLRTSGVALAAGIGAALMLGQMVGQASAMPANGLAAPAASVKETTDAQDVRYVCGPYRCWWRPGPYWGPYYGYYAYGPGPYWHRPWWGWHRWGWHRHWA